MDASWVIMFNILRELSKTPCNCGNNGDNDTLFREANVHTLPDM